MKRIIFILLILFNLSCEKEPDYAMDFVGVYNAKEVGLRESFPLLIDKVDNSRIIIEVKLYGLVKRLNANIHEYSLTIPSQDCGGDDIVSGNGYLRGNTIVITYKRDGDNIENKIIGTK